MRISDWSSDVCSSDLITLVIALKLFKLVYPELRLNLLISPPPPNINLWFSARFLDQANNIQNLINYIDILITPFFYIALYFIRRSIYVLAGIVFLVLYIEYVDAAYIEIGRASCRESVCKYV